MIGQVKVRLSREALRARMRDEVRRQVDARVSDMLAGVEARPAVPDEKLTTERWPDGLSRDV